MKDEFATKVWLDTFDVNNKDTGRMLSSVLEADNTLYFFLTTQNDIHNLYILP